MQIEEYRTALSLIQHSRLLFENSDDIRKYLLKKTNAQGRVKNNRYNSLSHKNIGNRAIQNDFCKLEKYSAALTDGSFGLEGQEHLYNLSLLIDDYRSATNSGDFNTPLNSRPEMGRGIFHYKNRFKIEQLQNLLYNYLTNPNIEDKGLYSTLKLNIENNRSIVRNYYLSIGILLLLNAIPFCRENSRPGRSSMNLKNDTDTTFSFLEGLFMLDGEIRGTLKWELNRYRQLSNSKEWCRLQLIYSTTELISKFAIQVDPSIESDINIPLNERTVNFIPCNSIYWRSRGQGNEQIFKFEPFPKGTNNSAYLFRYINGKNMWERYRLTFYESRVIIITLDDSDIIKLTSGGKYENSFIGSYRLEKNLIQFSSECKDMSFVSLEPAEIEDVPLYIKMCEKIKTYDKIEVIAVLQMIGTGAIILDNGDKLRYMIKPTESNHLGRYLSSIRIGDKIGIKRYDGREFLVFDTVYNQDIFEITTKEQKDKYGIYSL